MVSSFSRVDELHQTHNLVRHGDPKDRFCFCQTDRMSVLVVFALSCDLRNNSEGRRVLTVLVPTVHPQMNSELDSWLACSRSHTSSSHDKFHHGLFRNSRQRF